MNLSHVFKNDICIITIETKILGEEVDQLFSYVDSILESGTIAGMILDLKRVEAINSLGIGFLFSIFKSLQQRNSPFALCNISSESKDIFNAMAIYQTLSVYPTEQDALNAIKG